MKKVSPFLWFNGTAADAATFYTSLFPESSITHADPMIITFTLSGQQFTALNGGPMYSLNPSISLFITCETEEETDRLWQQLSEDGKVMMPLDKYPWSQKYGFWQDKFGLSWQIMWTKMEDVGQKITPSLLFVGKEYGHGEEAIKFYTSVFPDSSIRGINRNGPGEPAPEGKLKHGQFTIGGTVMMAMDGFGNHEFGFNEAFSLFVECNNQEEVDYYWNKLMEGGGNESQCGWLKDKFGVSWQVIPKQLMTLMGDKDREKSGRVMQAILKMKKIIVADLEKAYAG